MKTQKQRRKLNFNKETVVNLNSNDLAKQRGGLTEYTFNLRCSYSRCGSFNECTLPTQTVSGDGGTECQCPGTTPTTQCTPVCQAKITGDGV